MSNKLSWEEIKQQYPNEWVMLIEYEFKDNKTIDPSSGEVVAHHGSRKQFGELMKQVNAKDAAIMYTGQISDGRSILCKIRNK